MIYHVNERKKKNKPWIFILPSSFLLSCLFIEAWLLQGPSYPTNLNKFSSIVTGNLCPFQVFDDVCSQFDVDLASDLAPLEGTENPRKQPNCKSLINKKQKLLHYNKKLLLHIPTYLSYIQKMNKNTNSSVSSPRGKKIPKPSFAGLPTIKLKQSYYHVYVDL